MNPVMSPIDLFLRSGVSLLSESELKEKKWKENLNNKILSRNCTPSQIIYTLLKMAPQIFEEYIKQAPEQIEPLIQYTCAGKNSISYRNCLLQKSQKLEEYKKELVDAGLDQIEPQYNKVVEIVNKIEGIIARSEVLTEQHKKEINDIAKDLSKLKKDRLQLEGRIKKIQDDLNTKEKNNNPK